MTTRDGFTDAHGVTWVRDSEPQAPAADTIPLKDVARLDLKPGDTLVVTLREPVTTQMATTVRDRILAILGDEIDEHHLLVIPETAKVSILRTDGHPLAQWDLELLARQAVDRDQP